MFWIILIKRFPQQILKISVMQCLAINKIKRSYELMKSKQYLLIKLSKITLFLFFFKSSQNFLFSSKLMEKSVCLPGGLLPF